MKGGNMYKNIEAEKAVLGSCMIDKEAYILAVEELLPSDFSEPQYQTLFEVMLKMLSDSVVCDIITVSTEYVNNQIGEVLFLTEIINSVPTSKNIEQYISLVKQSSIKRKQKNLLIEVEGGKDIEKAMIELEKLSLNKTPEETLQIILENTLVNTLKGTDFKFGIHAFNKYLGGLDKGELLTIGGYTSQGKSDLAIQMAINMAKKERGVLFLSTEMLPAEIGRRILGNLTSTKVMDLRKGMLSEEERELLEYTSHEVGESWNMNIKKIYSIDDVHKYVRKYEPEILFLDYIQNLSGETDYKTATRNIKTLQSITLQHEIATVCVSQLSRNKEETREPRLTDLRDSGRIEECSNMVAFIYWKDRLKQQNKQRFGGEPPEEIELLISKNRDGLIGRCMLDFFPEYAQISDVMEEEYQKNLDYTNK